MVWFMPDLPVPLVVALVTVALSAVFGGVNVAFLNYVLAQRSKRVDRREAAAEQADHDRQARQTREDEARREQIEREFAARQAQFQREWDAAREDDATRRHQLTNQLTAAIGQHELAQKDIARIRIEMIEAQREAGHVKTALHDANIKIVELEARVRVCEDKWAAQQIQIDAADARQAGTGGH